MKASADPDPEATRRRIHRERRIRTFIDGEGAWNLHARGTPESGAEFMAALQPLWDAIFTRARSQDVTEPTEAYGYDALLELARWAHAKTTPPACAAAEPKLADPAMADRTDADGEGEPGTTTPCHPDDGASPCRPWPVGSIEETPHAMRSPTDARRGSAARGADASAPPHRPHPDDLPPTDPSDQTPRPATPAPADTRRSLATSGPDGSRPPQRRWPDEPPPTETPPATERATADGDLPAASDPRTGEGLESVRAATTHEPKQPVVQPPSVPTGPPAKITVGIDLEAIFRGYPVDGETCEIFGVGPVSVEAVRQLMAGNPFIAAVLRKGKQVMGVAHLGRGANAHQATALQWTMPACTVDGCPSQAHLQNDHNVPFASCRETELGNLDPLCTFHHNLKTTRGWSLVAGTGKRAFVPHDDPRHPRSRHVA